MRIEMLICVLALATASSRAAPQTPTPPPKPTAGELNVTTSGNAFGLEWNAEDRRVTRTVLTPLDQAWRALPAIYKSWGFELSRYDSTTHQISGQRVRSRGPIGGKALTSYLECGETAGIPNAMRWDITLQISTAVVAHAGGSDVITQVTAIAKPSGFGGDAVHCTANEGIAAAIAEAIQRVK